MLVPHIFRFSTVACLFSRVTPQETKRLTLESRPRPPGASEPNRAEPERSPNDRRSQSRGTPPPVRHRPPREFGPGNGGKNSSSAGKNWTVAWKKSLRPDRVPMIFARSPAKKRVGNGWPRDGPWGDRPGGDDLGQPAIALALCYIGSQRLGACRRSNARAHPSTGQMWAGALPRPSNRIGPEV